MSSRLSVSDREMIDEAIASGKVTKIAEGVRADTFCGSGGKEASRSHMSPSRKGRSPCPIVAERRELIRKAADGTKTRKEIREDLEIQPHTFVADVKFLEAAGHSLSFKVAKRGPRNGGPSTDKAAIKRAERGDVARAAVRDRRRFKEPSPALAGPAVDLPADHRAVTDAESYFPGRVFDVSDAEAVLKDGSNNAKIGGDVLVGHLKGARILTLTLEERATCPTTCVLWRGCYGNNMQHARRWRHGSELEAQIEREVAEACSQHEHVLVRLHVLGDFYSIEYAMMWAWLLNQHDNLSIFGFTAWKAHTEIGSVIAHMRDDFGRRCSIRHSDMTGPWGSATLDFETMKKKIGDAIVCPEQRDAYVERNRRGTHCGSCAVCWSCDAPVFFIEH